MIVFQRGNTKFGLLQKENIDPESWMSKGELDEIELLRNTKRKLEFIGVRQLRNQLIPNTEIEYNSKGKPSIKGKGKYLSISHSEATVFMGASNIPLGIDIEQINKRILRVLSKFTHKDESKLYAFDSLEDLTILWTIKESMYKLYSRKGLSFKEDIRVVGRSGNEHECILKTDDVKFSHLLRHEKLNNEILTYNIT